MTEVKDQLNRIENTVGQILEIVSEERLPISDKWLTNNSRTRKSPKYFCRGYATMFFSLVNEMPTLLAMFSAHGFKK